MSDEFISLFRLWKTESITALVSVRGYAELLLSGQVGDLDQKQRKFLDVIYDQASRAIHAWHNNAQYLEFGPDFDNQSLEMQAVSLEQVFKHMSSHPNARITRTEIDIELPPSRPTVR